MQNSGRSWDNPAHWCRRVLLRGISDEGLKRRFVADGVDVGVVSCHFAAAVPPVDCLAKVFDCLGRLTGEALAAGDVVEEVGLIGACGDDLASQLSPPGRSRPTRTAGVRAPTARLRACAWSRAARSRSGVVSRSPIRSAAGTSGQRTNRPRLRPDQAPTARCRRPASRSRAEVKGVLPPVCLVRGSRVVAEAASYLHLCRLERGLHSECAAGPTLAREAVADRDGERFSGRLQPELTAVASCFPSGHGPDKPTHLRSSTPAPFARPSEPTPHRSARVSKTIQPSTVTLCGQP